MRIEITKEWSLRMAQIEGNAEIGAGQYALDPVFDGETVPGAEKNNEPSIAFGRFVRLMRRDRGLTLEKLAEDTDLEIGELVEIEDDTRHKPELRTVYQLANYFKVPRANLMQVAGLTAPRDSRLVQEAVRFAARSEPVAELTPEERAALEAFVAVLSEQK
jgi:transcriptional regulator with XRE-family HTH domain